MYESFFGLRQAPFSIAPDPRYLYMSERHREALAHLLYGLGGVGGFVLLTGDIGAGKTTVCRCFLEQVPKHCHVAYIFNPKLTVLELLQSVCEELHIPVMPTVTGAPTIKDYLDPLNQFLLAAHGAGHRSVLVIDEAQNLSADVLEQLRLLTNLETNERKLLQIILIGQPELRDMVARPELEQLAQRVTARYHLGPLDEDETARYLAHRLAVAGRKGVMPFDLAALRRIHLLSRGVPRRINLLADRTLLGAYSQGHSVVGVEMVDRAAAEVFDQRLPQEAPAAEPRPRSRAAPGRKRRPEDLQRWLLWGGMAATLALLLGGLWAIWAGLRGQDGAGRAALPVAAPSQPAVAATGAVAADEPVVLSPPSASAPLPPPAGTAVSVGVPGLAPSASPASQAAGGEVTAATALAIARAWPAVRPASATAPMATLPRFSAAADWPALYAERDEAWRELAAHWVLALPPGEPCQMAGRQQLACYRSSAGTLALLKQLDRPVVLKLVDAQGRAGRAMLLGLNAENARLGAGNRQWVLPAAQLERLWRGEFGTLWRVPPGYTRPLAQGATGPAADALVQGLAAQAGASAPVSSGRFDALTRERLMDLQRIHGLPEAGRAGPASFMVLNRLLGVVEPRLGME